MNDAPETPHSSGLPSLEVISTDLGEIHLIRMLAAGGMGEVLYAELRGVEGFFRPLAIKRIHRRFLDSAPEAQRLFIREARVSALLRHHNIVRTELLLEREDQLYLVMEYVDGRPLSWLPDAARAARRTIPLSMGLQIVSQVLVDSVAPRV